MLTIVVILSAPVLQSTNPAIKIGVAICLSDEIVKIRSRFFVRVPYFTVNHKIVILTIRTLGCHRTKVFSYLFYQIMQKLTTRTTPAVFQTAYVSSAVTTIIGFPVNVQTIIIGRNNRVYQCFGIALNGCDMVFSTFLSTGKSPISFCCFIDQLSDFLTGSIRVFRLYFF